LQVAPAHAGWPEEALQPGKMVGGPGFGQKVHILLSESASRPEVIRYARRVDRISLDGSVLITDDSEADTTDFDHVLNFKPPFGPYPRELAETYPFNAEVPEDTDDAAMNQAVKITRELIKANPEARFTFRLKIEDLGERLELS
jgi:hypothetical protein